MLNTFQGRKVLGALAPVREKAFKLVGKMPSEKAISPVDGLCRCSVLKRCLLQCLVRWLKKFSIYAHLLGVYAANPWILYLG